MPVPLTDIEAAAGEATPGPWTTPDVSAVWGGDGWVLTDASYEDAAHIATADPPTVLALCEALRIAVEGLDRVERWYVCKNVPDDDGDFITCRGFTDDSTGWCGWCCALDAIESVRELVDLGEKP